MMPSQERIVEYLKRNSLPLSRISGDEDSLMYDFLKQHGLMTEMRPGLLMPNNEGRAFIHNSYYFNPVPLNVYDWKMNIIEQLRNGQAILNGDGDLFQRAQDELKQDGTIEQVGTTYLKVLTPKGRRFLTIGLSYNEHPVLTRCKYQDYYPK